MTRREYVKAAIEHRTTDRVPYYIRFCGDAWESLKEVVGDLSPQDFIDDDVLAKGDITDIAKNHLDEEFEIGEDMED